MDKRTTTILPRSNNYNQYAGFDGQGEFVQQRLNTLLALNAETARQKAMFRTEQEQLEADLMKDPLSLDEAFSYYGLMLGTLPPAALFIRFAIESRAEAWVFGVIGVMNILSAVVGFFSGKLIAKMIGRMEKAGWIKMLLVLPFIGFFWGMMAGAAGGIIIFLIGALFGALIGGVVGSLALPVFTIFHRLLKKGEMIDRKHFLPLAFGVTATICALILGF